MDIQQQANRLLEAFGLTAPEEAPPDLGALVAEAADVLERNYLWQ